MSIGRVGHLPSPVRGEKTNDVAAVVARAPAEQVAEAKLAQVSHVDIDAFIEQRSGRAASRGLIPSMIALLSPAAPKPPSAAATAMANSLQQALGALHDVYKDGLVTEGEIAELGGALSAIGDVLALQDPAILQMLPRGVRERLQDRLFEPLQLLHDTAHQRSQQVLGAVTNRDLMPLRERLDDVKVVFTPLDVGRVAKSGGSLTGAERYAVGDYVAVPRSSGAVSLGVVTGHDPDGLRVEVLAGNSVGMQKVRPEDLASANPLKIGDYIQHGNAQAWITGLGPDGKLTATVQDAKGIHHVGGENVDRLAAAVAHQISDLRTQAKAVARAPAAPPVAAQSLVRAGGFENVTADAVKGNTATGGLFTYRGVDYADYNEDGAVLGVVPKGNGVKSETFYAGAFDQAGGMGHVKETGAASRIAAQHFAKASEAIARGAPPEQTLRGAVDSAQAELCAVNDLHKVNMATTFVGGVVQDGYAHIVNAGDAGAVLYDKQGRVKEQTESHNIYDEAAKKASPLSDVDCMLRFAHNISSCLGQVDQPPKVDAYKWKVEPGDYVVFFSDGVGDLKLQAQKNDLKAGKSWTRPNGDVAAEEIGRVVAKAGSAEAAAQAVARDFAGDQVRSGEGKPDNAAAVVVRIAG